jgi:NAD(P)-dependent dehydrogenase (short-subunit alcohol dehydrogenase family)
MSAGSTMSTLKLTDQIAVITGASSGIGQAIATRFAAEGARVINLDLRPSLDPSITFVACDVSEPDAVAAALKALPVVDILVNSAGIAHIGTAESTSPAEFAKIFRVNVAGVYHTLHEVLPKMRAAGRGVILNLCSVAAKVGIPDRFAYSMSKGAVLAMTLSVARDYVDKGIRCNCICPARVHTPFVDDFIARHYPGREAEVFSKLEAAQPIGRMGTPDEIASLALYLCSQDAAFITGSTHDIDGGFTLLR